MNDASEHWTRAQVPSGTAYRRAQNAKGDTQESNRSWNTAPAIGRRLTANLLRKFARTRQASRRQGVQIGTPASRYAKTPEHRSG